MKSCVLLALVVTVSCSRPKPNERSTEQPVADSAPAETIPNIVQTLPEELATLLTRSKKVAAFSSSTYEVVSQDSPIENEEEDDGRYYAVGSGQKPPAEVVVTTLTVESAAELLSILTDPTSYDADPAACHYPHLSLAFYDEPSKPSTMISICIDCANVQSKPRISAIHDAPVVGDDVMYGLGTGVERIKKWCKNNGISTCEGRTPYWAEDLD